MKELKEILYQKVTKRKDQSQKLKSQICETDLEIDQLQFKLRQEQAKLKETQLLTEMMDRQMSNVCHRNKVQNMMEMSVEGNMVSDDESGESSVDGGLVKEQGPEAKKRILTASVASRKKQAKALVKTIIETIDDNDDVSSSEYLDLPGSLPRNSFVYDHSKQEPAMQNSGLTLENANTTSS